MAVAEPPVFGVSVQLQFQFSFSKPSLKISIIITCAAAQENTANHFTGNNGLALRIVELRLLKHIPSYVSSQGLTKNTIFSLTLSKYFE